MVSGSAVIVEDSGLSRLYPSMSVSIAQSKVVGLCVTVGLLYWGEARGMGGEVLVGLTMALRGAKGFRCAAGRVRAGTLAVKEALAWRE